MNASAKCGLPVSTQTWATDILTMPSAHLPLRWIMEEAKHRGLKFKVEPFGLFPRTGMCQLRTSTAKVAKCQVRIASAQQIATAEIVEG